MCNFSMTSVQQDDVLLWQRQVGRLPSAGQTHSSQAEPADGDLMQCLTSKTHVRIASKQQGLGSSQFTWAWLVPVASRCQAVTCLHLQSCAYSCSQEKVAVCGKPALNHEQNPRQLCRPSPSAGMHVPQDVNAKMSWMCHAGDGLPCMQLGHMCFWCGCVAGGGVKAFTGRRPRSRLTTQPCRTSRRA